MAAGDMETILDEIFTNLRFRHKDMVLVEKVVNEAKEMTLSKLIKAGKIDTSSLEHSRITSSYDNILYLYSHRDKWKRMMYSTKTNTMKALYNIAPVLVDSKLLEWTTINKDRPRILYANRYIFNVNYQLVPTGRFRGYDKFIW